MNTQQIVDFVKQEINKGVTKERVAQVLRINGVAQTEIDQAFSGLQINTPTATPPLTPPAIPPTQIPINKIPPPPIPPPMAPRKSHLGLTIITIILLLFIGAGGASAYVYIFQPNLVKSIPLIGNLLNPVPTPEVALAKMLANVSQIKTSNYDITFTAAGVIPTSTTTDSSGSISITMKGKGDVTNASNPKNETILTATGKMDSEGMQISADLSFSVITLDKVFYGKINRLPTFIPIPELSSITGQWIKIDPKTMASTTSEFSGLDPANFNFTTQEIKDLQAEIMAAKPLAFGKLIGEEEINGKQTYNFPITFSKDGLNKIVDTNPNFTGIKSYIDQTDFPEGKVWIGQDDFLPYKIAFENIAISAPSELKLEYPNAKATISIVMEQSNFNQPVDIKAPTTFKTIEEIMGGMMPGFDSTSTDLGPSETAQKSALSSLKASAEIFKDENNDSYIGFCKSKYVTDPTMTCNNRIDSYAVSIKLSDGKYGCVYSGGEPRFDLTKDLTGGATACPKN